MMKLVASIALLFVAVAFVLACDPNGNNQPEECNSANLNVPIRNFWDPTRYWLCNSVGAAAQDVRCNDTLLFDSVKGECISWSEWTWVPNCPEEN